MAWGISNATLSFTNRPRADTTTAKKTNNDDVANDSDTDPYGTSGYHVPSKKLLQTFLQKTLLAGIVTESGAVNGEALRKIELERRRKELGKFKPDCRTISLILKNFLLIFRSVFSN